MAASSRWVLRAAPQAALDLDADDDDVPAPPAPLAQPAAPPQPSNKQQYLGTWSHTTRADLQKPKDVEKAAFGELVV